MMKRAMVYLTALILGAPAMAAIPAQKILVGQGATFGGAAGSGFTLLDVRRTVDAKKKVERIVFDVGTRDGQPLKGLPGYYFAELKQNPQRLIIDFSQMPNASVDEAQLGSRFKKSLAVKGTTMTLDPVDNSLNLTFELKAKTKVRVYQVAGKKDTSKVVVDLISE